MQKDPRAAQWTRRDVLGVLGLGAAAAALPAATGPQFPKGAIIRTILKDLPPEALGGGGAILFHEHLSLAPDFMRRWIMNSRPMNPQAGRGNAAPARPPELRRSQTCSCQTSI